MAKLSEVVQSQYVKCLLYGHSGTGKTVFSTGGDGKTYVFDFDNKISSAATFYSSQCPKRLDEIEYDTYWTDAKLAHPIERFEMKLKELSKQVVDGKFQYKTIVLDSVTLFSESLMNYVMKMNPGVKRVFEDVPAMQDYLVHGTWFKQFMNQFLSFPCNVIVTGHIQQDDDNGTPIFRVQLSGKLADSLPKIFTEVYRSFVGKDKDGKAQYLAQTRSDGRFVCRTQIPSIPEMIPLKLEAVYHYLKQSTKQTGEQNGNN